MTERIGFVAALKTLEVMESINSWDIISAQGNKIKEGWKKISNKYSINLDIFGLDALPTFAFKHEDNLKFKTLITQEMLKKGFF